jgi:hypothetical protein
MLGGKAERRPGLPTIASIARHLLTHATVALVRKASVSAPPPDTPARDEGQAPARARSEAVPLLHSPEADL